MQSGQNHSGSCHERRCELGVVGDAGTAQEPRRVRVLDRRLVGRPDHLGHAGKPTGAAEVSVANLARANFDGRMDR